MPPRSPLPPLLLVAAAACGSAKPEPCTPRDLGAAPAAASATPEGHDWSKRFGGETSWRVASMTIDTFGDVIVVGSIDREPRPDGSGPRQDIWAMQLRPDGEFFWSKRFRSEGSQRGERVAIDSLGNTVILGSFEPDPSAGKPAARQTVLIQLDSSGKARWSRQLGGAGQHRFYGLALGAGSSALLAGELEGTLDLGEGSLTSAGKVDIVVLKIDSEGHPIWSKRFGNEAWQRATGVAVDPAGNALVVGSFNGPLDVGDGVAALPTSDGRDELFLLKLDPDGKPLWLRGFGARRPPRSTNEQHSSAIASDGDGNVYLAGVFTGRLDFGDATLDSRDDSDAFVAKLSGEGKHIWSRRLGGADTQTALDIAVDTENNVLVSGTLYGAARLCGGLVPSAGAGDIFALKLDPEGKALFFRRFGDAMHQEGNAIAPGPAGTLLLAGSAMGSVDFGGGPLDSGGTYSALVTRLRTSP